MSSPHETTDRLAGLSPAKRRLLLQKLQEQQAQRDETAPQVPALRPVPRDGELPLSFPQQRLWFLDRFEPGSNFYNVPAAFRLTGDLDRGALARSLSEIVRRHETLRTTIETVEGRPVQRIAEPRPVEIEVVDLTEVDEAEREERARQAAVEEAERPFHMDRGPLFRATLVALAPREHLLILNLHHVISDGWSIGVLLRELSVLYTAFVRGEESPLPELPVQYADFAAWQREHLQGERLESHLAYWREHLAGAPPALNLPTDRPRPAMQSFNGQALTFRIPETLSRAVRDLCQREGVTLFMALLAAFKVFLYRASGQDDVVVGAGIANRNRMETEPLIGFFVNTLAMRTRLAGNPTFRELLRRVREVALGAYAHQDLPFEKLVEELRPDRDLSRNPLVQVAFVFQNAPTADLALPGLTPEPFELEVAAAKFDWLLSLSDTEPEITGLLEFSSDLFDTATAVRMLGRYQELLEAFAADPEQRIRMLPLFTGEVAPALGLEPGRIETVAPLNTTQRDLFLDHAVAPESTIYSLGVSAPLGQTVDPERWHQAMAAVFEREPALRARFLSWHGEMLQVVERGAALPFEVVDQVSGWSALIQEKVKTPYRLEKGSLFRAFLVRGLPGGDVALLAYHHIVADALSGRLFLEKAAAEYASQSGTAAPDLSFFTTVGESLAHFDTPEIQSFWAERLKTVIPLELHSGVQRPARPASSRAVLAGEDLAELRSYCEGRISMAALLRGLFGTLLGRLLAPAGDFLIYDVVGGRPRGRTEAARTIGCFHQVIPTVFERSLLSDETPVRALLESLREERRNLGEMRNLSVLLQRQLLREEKIRFYYNFYDFAAFDLLGGRSVLTVHDSFPENEVHLIVSENASELEISLHWNERYVSDLALIDRLLAMARQVVRGAARLGDLEVLLESERGQLAAWNDTAVSYPEEDNLHLLLEAQAERTPEAVALAFEGAELTYRELHERANQLAWHLRGLGVGPESVVALAIPRSFEMMVGLLGILKAGGAYLPLDPDYPEERLRYMLADSGAAVLLLGDREIGGIDEYRGTAVRLGEIAGTLERQPLRPLRCETTGESLAYVIYTSGSTGRPKGAMNRHRAIANRLLWMQAQYGLTADDRVLQKTPLSFDVSVWELFWPLLTGARLVIARPEGHKDSNYLVELIREQAVTTLHFVPSMLRIWLEQRELRSCRSLRRVICSGEALTLEHQERFFAKLDAELHNLYGPTEAAVDVTYWACERQGSHGTVPIGSPVANTQIHLLDRELRPVPVGIPGELYIGGVQLARGYLGRPDLTADRFIPDPWSEGARLYRTGDLARRLSDGAVEYIGRVDHQIKLRGFRIELGEIEAVLRRLPGVQEVLVMVREDVPGDKALVAYLVAPPAGEARPGHGELSRFGRQSLPDYMVPAHFVWLEELPLLPNGKVDRRALPAPATARPDLDVAFAAAKNDTEQKIVAIWQEVLRLPKVGAEDNFFDLGGHSLLLVQVQTRVQEAFNRDIPVVELFRHPTARGLARFLDGKDGKDNKDGKDAVRERTAASTAVAVIGLAGRFPGARDLEDFWEKVRGGSELISFFSEEELTEAGVEPGLLARPGYVRAKAMLDGVDLFDAGFFGYTPREAEILDPQQRLFLEAAWEALENAGYDAQRAGGKVGVFAGQSFNTYLLENLWPNRRVMEAVGLFQTVLGNDKDYLATRTSYKIGLRGPSVNVQTACSTSLVAVHLACRSLLDGDCDMALAGGVSVGVPSKSGYLHTPGAIVSLDGHCAPFDAAAQGTVPGNGLGIVVLKRLDDALRDGDTIRAVIRGSAINNDGPDKVGFTAPSVDGQVAVISQALERAGVGAETIGYVEAHGTGTPLGDPIEVAALTRVYRAATDAVETVALGSLKSNLGHLDAAAGVAGLIKAVLALEHGAIPPSLHFKAPNPALGLESSPFYVNNHAVEWPRNGKPRRAGVSSFGIGGTNAHVILEEAPAVTPAVDQTGRPHLLVLSAQTPEALDAQASRLAEHLRRHPEVSLADVAWTLQAGRRVFAHRRAVLCHDREDAITALTGAQPQRVWDRFEESAEPSIAFLFPGQGAQHVGMAAGLYATEPGFRARVDECAEILAPRLGLDLRQLLYPQDPERREEAQRKLERTAFAQPALFTIEYALAGLWMDRGLRPAALLGHSVGEFVAATLAGVMELPDALALVALRGQLIDALPEGAMLSVELPESALLGLLGPGLSLAAVNGPSSCVVAGDFEPIDDLARQLTGLGVAHRRLHTSHAFHSHQMDAAMQPFADAVGRLHLKHPQIPYVSGLTGTWITARQATDPWYWARHLREAVRFADGVRTLAEGSGRVLLEVGPGSSLTSLARRQLGQGSGVADTIASLPHPKDRATDLETLAGALGRLWLCGARIDWRSVHGAARRRIPLPAYPFDRQRYWVNAPGNGMAWEPAAETLRPALSAHEGPRRLRSFESPETEIEEAIAQVWQELLGVERVGRNDGFFELGGHSLSGVQLVARLQERLPVELPADVLFDRPTVASLAELVEAQLLDRLEEISETEAEQWMAGAAR